MTCNFNDETKVPSIEFQLMEYCLSLVPTGFCNTQSNQVSLTCTPGGAALFRTMRCIDIKFIPGNPPGFDGNFEYYDYKGVQIVIYKLVV